MAEDTTLTRARPRDGSGGEPGRRDRKKAATRQALRDVALRLFAEQGFEATTIEQIADIVDVSPRTFHRYFARKEDVLFGDQDERVTRFRVALAARPTDEPVVPSVRAAVLAVIERTADRRDLERVRARLVSSSPDLRAHNLRYQDEWAAAVAEHVASRTGRRPDDAWPALVGICTVAALAVARRRWTSGRAGDLPALVAESFDLLAQLGDTAARMRPAT